MKFCDECGREILSDDELGKIDKRNYNIAGKRHTTKTTYCKDCVEEMQNETTSGLLRTDIETGRKKRKA